MTFVGFDLHKRYITACALDATGVILAEIRQLSTTVDAVLVWLGALPGPVTVGMEATLYWECLATRLRAAGHTVHVAHAFHVKLIWQARAKTDPIDARKLAELLRVSLFPAIWLPDLEPRRRPGRIRQHGDRERALVHIHRPR
ncbi:MAG: transposase [Vicinamibacterales bacterium]